MRPPNTQKLAKLTLKLIEKDLKRIAGDTQKAPPGMFALTLSRYLSVLLNHKKTTEKIEDEERRMLKNLSTHELKKLAGLAE